MGVTTSVQAQTSTTGEAKSGEVAQQSSSGLMQEPRNTGDTTKWIQLYTADGQPATVVMFPAPEHKTPTFGLSQQTQQQTSVSDKNLDLVCLSWYGEHRLISSSITVSIRI